MFSTPINQTQTFIDAVFTQFKGRAYTEAKKTGANFDINLNMEIINDNKTLQLKFYGSAEQHAVNIPLPFVENGVTFIEQSNVRRALSSFWDEESQMELNYIAVMYAIMLGTPVGFVAENLIKSTSYIQQMIYSFMNGNAHITAYKLQKAINSVVNKMPLHETYMNSFIINSRLIIKDLAFDDLKSPNEQLVYQVEKAKKYFNKGWTSIGLSDGNLASKNYILKTGLRKFSPFGKCYHNPQRNLYSTLGMKGDEFPNIQSQSMATLSKVGINRTGWNLFTVFVSIPDVFEDQIMVDSSMSDKFILDKRRYQLFGNVVVKEGDLIKTDDVIGHSPDQQPIIFKVHCESAVVKRISTTTTNVGGQIESCCNVVIEYKRYFRDGFKITNLHGNKGIVRLADLGYAIDPRTGNKRKIDVIVNAKTVGKRANYGQILEAIYNNVVEADNTSTPVILPDDWSQDINSIATGIERRGFRPDGTWDCVTYAGKVRAICGNIFWGCIKTPQDQVWKKGATAVKNNKEIRTAGLKFSHVEIRSLSTLFGDKNAIIDEIMTYIQGYNNLRELLLMNGTKVGILPPNKSILNVQHLNPVDQSMGTLLSKEMIDGSISDEFFMPNGFVFKLPYPYQTIVDKNNEPIHEGPPILDTSLNIDPTDKVYNIDHIYVPSGTLRKCWRHSSAKYGLSEVSVIINNVVAMSKRLLSDITDAISYRLYYQALTNYFSRITNMLCSKRGDIASQAMAVRYPFSVKATATLSTTLPKNVVEIPRHMAKTLNVNDGDVVIAERFPCLGFVSIRLQKVKITDDPNCEYVIRVSNNSLVSQNLDFDGDVLYLASFHTPESKELLRKEFNNPNKTCHAAITYMNERKGKPCIKEYTLNDYNITEFPPLTNDRHAELVEKNTGVKAQTGPVIALTYNVMRLVENSELGKHHKDKVEIELFLEKAAQSVFEQKHGGVSLYEIVIDGVCTADIETLVSVGFKRGITTKICNMIQQKAISIGISDLYTHHKLVKEGKASNIVSLLVRKQHRIYFASRATLDNVKLIEALNSDAVDVPSNIYKWATACKSVESMTEWEKLEIKNTTDDIKSKKIKEATLSMCDLIETTFCPTITDKRSLFAKLSNSLTLNVCGEYEHE